MCKNMARLHKYADNGRWLEIFIAHGAIYLAIKLLLGIQKHAPAEEEARRERKSKKRHKQPAKTTAKGIHAFLTRRSERFCKSLRERLNMEANVWKSMAVPNLGRSTAVALNWIFITPRQTPRHLSLTSPSCANFSVSSAPIISISTFWLRWGVFVYLKIRFMQTAQVPAFLFVHFAEAPTRLCKRLQAKLTRSQGLSRSNHSESFCVAIFVKDTPGYAICYFFISSICAGLKPD